MEKKRLLRNNTPLNPPPSLKLRWTRICWSLGVSRPLIRGDLNALAMTTGKDCSFTRWQDRDG